MIPSQSLMSSSDANIWVQSIITETWANPNEIIYIYTSKIISISITIVALCDELCFCMKQKVLSKVQVAKNYRSQHFQDLYMILKTDFINLSTCYTV